MNKAIKHKPQQSLPVRILVTILFLCSGFAANAETVGTEITNTDIQTIVRTISFLESPPPSDFVMAIIYDATSDTSLKRATEVQRLIAAEKEEINLKLISTDETDKLKDIDFAFVTEGAQSKNKALWSELEKNKILSFTLDRDCINTQRCAIYVNAKNRVEIILNKSITDASNINFKPVFLMMVKVI